MTWILIVWMGYAIQGSSSMVAIQDFKSEAACNIAGEQSTKIKPYRTGPYVSWACVEKPQ